MKQEEEQLQDVEEIYNEIGQSKSFDSSSFSKEEQGETHERAKEYAGKRRDEIKEEKLKKSKKRKKLERAR
ncbi:MAG: hypothetical protein J7K33_12665 [Candidatus Marinimicrobia bacterium]|nr:hypothetical protein [Candidatus Neomarinimicrobiota bacterium]